MASRVRDGAVRIVAGSHRGARLAAAPGRDVRPTAARTRAALFDLLDGGRFGDPYRDQSVVDAFAGTGALGLEALSRGAAHAVFIEVRAAARRALRQNIAKLGVEGRTTVIAADAARFTRRAPGAAALVLLDPPYGSGLVRPCLEAMRSGGWIGAATLVTVETGAREDLALPDWARIVEDRRYGAARLVLVRPLCRVREPVLDQPAGD